MGSMVAEFKIDWARAIEDAAIEYADVYTELQCDADNDHQREHREALKNLRETIKRGLEVAAAPQPTTEESSAVAQPHQSQCGHCGRQVIGDAWPIRPAPAWHDAPTCGGLWLNNINGRARQISTQNITQGTFSGSGARWYGPIQEDAK